MDRPHPEVEFIDAEPRTASTQLQSSAGPGSSGAPAAGVRALAVPLAWTAAGALCLLATFQTIFTYRFTGSQLGSTGGYDAWGNPLHSTLRGEHGARYALALWVCAAAIALLAMVALRPDGTRDGHRADTLRHLVAGAGTAVTALLAGVLVGVALDVESSFATYRALAVSLDDGGAAGGVELSVGGCLWFGVAALACCVAALVLSFRADRNRR